MKYVFHTAGEIRDAYDFVTDFEGMTFEAENDQAAFDHVSDLATQEDEKVLAEIEAGRLDKHACQLPLTEVRGLATSLG